MSGFKEPNFADRQKAAMQARQNILNKFRAQPGADDPEVKRRQAEREAQAAVRAKAREAKEAAKAEQKRLEAEADTGRGGHGGRPLGWFFESDVCRFSNDDAATGFVTGQAPKFFPGHG